MLLRRGGIKPQKVCQLSLTAGKISGISELEPKGGSGFQSIDCNSFPGLNRTALPGGIETSAPVRGLRPMPVFRGRTLNTPNPRSSMRLPWASDFFMLSKTVSTASSALVLVMPVLATTSLMMSSLITNGSRVRRLDNPSSDYAMGDKIDCQRQHLSHKLTGRQK